MSTIPVWNGCNVFKSKYAFRSSAFHWDTYSVQEKCFNQKSRYFNIFLHVFLWLPYSLAIHSSHWIFRTNDETLSFKIFYKERLWPFLFASLWPQSCRQTPVVPNANDSPSHCHSRQWSRQFSTQPYKKLQLRQCRSWTGFYRHDTWSILLF